MLYLYHRKIQKQRTHLHNYKLCELVKVSYNSSDYFVRLLLLNLIKSWCESSIGRVTIITPKLGRIRLRFGMKVRFSDAFLVSHRIMQRQRMQKYMLCSWHMWCGVQVHTFASRVKLLALSSFVISYAIHFWVNLRWNGPTWQAKTINFILRHEFALKEYVLRKSYARDRHAARANQSAFLEVPIYDTD